MDINRIIGTIEENEHHPLPEWARFLVKTGEEWANLVDETTVKHTFALSMPDTRLAASLVATGFVAKRNQMTWQDDNQDTHFQRLRDLPLDTEVKLQDGPNWVPAIKIPNEDESSDMIKFQHTRKNKGMTSSFPKQSAHRVQILPGKNSIKPSKTTSLFISNLISEKATQKFMLSSNWTLSLVREITPVQDELTNTIMSTSRKGDATGSLNDIVRPQKKNSNAPYQTVLLSPLSKSQDPENLHKPVIFGNSLSFIRTWERHVAAHSVIILGRTENAYNASRAIINESLGTSGETTETFPAGDIPQGIEFVSYTQSMI